MRRTVCLLTLLLVALATGIDAQDQPRRKFLGGPLVLEDQGSFFVGGVPKISEHAARPFAPPGQPAPAATPARAPTPPPTPTPPGGRRAALVCGWAHTQ
jgi:hypothetical protein